jgi:hypothetical protein
MDYLTALQVLLNRLPIRGKGRIADAVLSNKTGDFKCHPLPGVTVFLRPNQRIERWMWAGIYEPELVSLLKKALKPGMTVLDLGANIGYFSVIAAALVGEKGQVHAFDATESRPSKEEFGTVPLGNGACSCRRQRL